MIFNKIFSAPYKLADGVVKRIVFFVLFLVIPFEIRQDEVALYFRSIVVYSSNKNHKFCPKFCLSCHQIVFS